jgi:hypothetical protein
MRERYAGSLDITDRCETQTIQFPKAIAQTLPRLFQIRTWDLGIGNFPRRHTFENTRGLTARGVTLDYSTRRIRRLTINSNCGQTGAVKDGGLP